MSNDYEDVDWDALTHLDEAFERKDLQWKLGTNTTGAWNFWDFDPARLKGLRHLPVDLMMKAKAGDELWWYSNDDICWQHLCGRAGWALVRGGVVIETTVEIMN